MKVYEVINQCLQEQKLSKKAFYEKLINLHPHLLRTGKPPCLKTVYKYLNGQLTIPIDLIPFIAEALDICEQELFDDSFKAKNKYAKHIVQSSSKKELENIQKFMNNALLEKNILFNDHNFKQNIKIVRLLPYAPNIFLDAVVKKLENYRDMFEKEICSSSPDNKQNSP